MLDRSVEIKLCKVFKAKISGKESIVISEVSNWCNKSGLCVHKKIKNKRYLSLLCEFQLPKVQYTLKNKSKRKLLSALLRNIA